MHLCKKAAADIEAELARTWTIIVQDLKNDSKFCELEDEVAWMEYVLEMNVPFGKKARATSVIWTYRSMAKARTPEIDFLVSVVGWMTEIGHTAGLILDDIMDGSQVRRGRPAWYMRDDVGMSAINDGLLLENLNWMMLRKYFHGTEFYDSLFALMQETVLLTILGQSLDTRMSLQSDISKFSRKQYNKIVKYKTSLYSFYSPVATGLIFAGITDADILNSSKTLLCEIGRLFQIQDDYLDLYGNPAVTGKVGTDIQEGKCTWFVVEALEKANESQKLTLMECYGSWESEDVQKVKDVYAELQLPREFRRFEMETTKHLEQKITEFELQDLRPSLSELLAQMFGREK